MGNLLRLALCRFPLTFNEPISLMISLAKAGHDSAMQVRHWLGHVIIINYFRMVYNIQSINSHIIMKLASSKTGHRVVLGEEELGVLPVRS